MIYMLKNEELVPYVVKIHSTAGKERALKHFRDMVQNEDIKRYWTVMESWVSSTRGLAPHEDINRRELLIISEYDWERMENAKVLLPYRRRFSDDELLKLAEHIRQEDMKRGILLPEVTKDSLKDPQMLNILTNFHPDQSWGGTIEWETEEQFTIGSTGDVQWMDRWNFYLEDNSGELYLKGEEARIAEIVKEIKEMDMTEIMQFTEQMSEAMRRDGVDYIPPVPPVEEVRQILIRIAESGCLVKMSQEPADVHKMAQEIREADPNIPQENIHAKGEE